ncbi:hypothetical protein ABB37_09173 [Leptomonas pyrrhocoris]|uniref:Uncharacterized protein n=1 Tax=Leptomonas pyrrhocoris TaxID=157538 RepID=A0A0N0DRI5_LEPPY|nr:hypothetical protein ABB37_09173 [Leptomonas pyrrhocoris]XP_015652951.1 hypothetical protein ABB37_09173 [Leptomonas pyrrhocoris]XP_015652952.1 hypothetical protein ABB37_09173 [Leptomonas pyrrhocoris]KPA74511.1 hypothetical protein ABB37_09173 [Leptomonas pyrrhocoris]KPA74512.1 hypothetical protein ABB37_09173 [Leptomonas pyrrhocoris]KPA74513.1 hypothetical protein ABB37_09173 [Leptomonas pyrrhocoris]|eukprot:XP_015652950.1 hypothetical protein ABB37_09173 [Leptomonas pyrrhocoris]
MATAACPVEWHARPVELHVSHPHLPNSTSVTEALPSTVSASPDVALHAAGHILFFPVHGGPVVVAPLTVTVEEAKEPPATSADEAKGNVPKTESAATAATESVHLPDGVMQSAACGASAAVAAGEWTDAVDEEAMAFFGDEDDA